MAISSSLVSQLIASQFPQWAHLPIEPVEFGGWDNTTFHLGTTLSVRLPSAERYAGQVEKERRWLPKLAPHLPLPIPTPVAMGMPTYDYPWHWSIYRWIEGENAAFERIDDLEAFARTLAQFLTALQQVDPVGGPPLGAHNFYRGGPLATYDSETRHAIATLEGEVDAGGAIALWEDALKTTWRGSAVWIHGDVSASNLLVNKGRLSAVIDFGCLGIGDPACDLAIAWTLFSRASRETFQESLSLDGDTWIRGRGWALWKALITLVEHLDTNSLQAEKARRVIGEALKDAAA
ncbi:MAG: aminoglycoside phosphotransferase family protein [Cyanobacteria bacterium P01_F01_bin.33]